MTDAIRLTNLTKRFNVTRGRSLDKRRTTLSNVEATERAAHGSNGGTIAVDALSLNVPAGSIDGFIMFTWFSVARAPASSYKGRALRADS
jgi:hypothetical protein